MNPIQNQGNGNSGKAREISIVLPSGSVRRYPAGTTVAQMADSIRPELRKQALAGKIDGELVDLSHPLQQDGRLELVMPESTEGLELLRQSAAHILAQALKRLYGGNAVKLGSGQAAPDGFYCDVQLERSLSGDDLADVEKEMDRIVQQNLPIERREVSRLEAERLLQEREEPFKLELLLELPEAEPVAVYCQGEFENPCAGPHLRSVRTMPICS